MDEKFIAKRLTELRIRKGISEYKMSLDMGHSGSYINSISSGKALPSMSEFLYICEYLGVTPHEFFCETTSDAPAVQKLYQLSKRLDAQQLAALIQMAELLADDET